MRHAEMLLLIDDQQAEVAESYGFPEQCMSTDHDVYVTLGNSLLDTRQFLCRNQPRSLSNFHREAAETLDERFGMLASQQRRRNDDGNLLAVHGGRKSCAQGDLGFAETDIPADQSIHGAAQGKLLQNGVYGCLLILGFLVWKAGTEFVISTVLHGKLRRFPQLSFSCNLNQLASNFANTIFHARFARLPGTAAEPIKLDRRLFRSVAGKKLDILDRQEQLVPAGIVQLQAIVRRSSGLDCAQLDEPANAVVDVNDEITCGKARGLGNEILRPPRAAPGAHQPVA